MKYNYLKKAPYHVGAVNFDLTTKNKWILAYSCSYGWLVLSTKW